jgi:hypothetical protein
VAASLGRLGVKVVAIAAVAVLLLIAIAYGLQRVGGIGTARSNQGTAATRVPTAVLAQGLTGFISDAYSIAYPTSWTHSAKTQQTTVGTLHLDSFSGGPNLTFQIGVAPSIPSDRLQSSLDPVARATVQGSLMQALLINQRRVYNKTEWLYSDYTQVVTNGVQQTTLHQRVLTANVGTQTYFIILVASKASFASVDAGSFEAMLRSFRIG